MKNQLREFSKIPLFFACILFLASYGRMDAQTITSNQIGSQGGYTYEFWKDSGGSGSMTLGSGGAFSVQWSNIGNLLARKGVRPGSKNQVVTYSANYNPSGNSYLCVYGWFTSPMVEYYIVDSWGSWRPPGGTAVGTVTSDGGTYDLYRTQRVNQPSIEGTATFYQYWSVRRSKRTSGTITVANHFNAWQSRGWTVGSMYEVSLTVEGYQSSGSANVTSMSMTTGGGDTGGGGSTGSGANTIVVRARGVAGGESINLRLNDQTIASWTLGTGYQNYTASTDATGGISVQYTNDASGRDVQVDYVQVNGSTRQAENQSYNTGVYQNGSCGGSNSEWLHCNGSIGFGDISGGGGTTTPSGNSITVRARGTSGAENIRLTVGGTSVGSWTLTTSYQNYTATTTATGGINVEYTNDASGRDVEVDYIQVGGVTRQAENQSTNTAVYQNGSCGGSNSQWMHCSGYIGFGTLGTNGLAQRADRDNLLISNVELEREFNVYPNPSKGRFTVDLPEEATSVQVLDFSGRVLRTVPVKGQRSLDLELKLAPGIYFVQMKNGSQIDSRRLIID